jgi:hypothetical protein
MLSDRSPVKVLHRNFLRRQDHVEDGQVRGAAFTHVGIGTRQFKCDLGKRSLSFSYLVRIR